MYQRIMYFVAALALVISSGLAWGADPFRQDSGPDGIVCVEAENYHANVEVGGHSWEEIGPTAGFTGELGMHSANGNGGHGNSGYSTASEHLDYEIEFVKTGTHYVWVKAWGADGTDDSCNIGLDGVETPNTDRMTGFKAWFKNGPFRVTV
jgi:hypothetical protein